MTTKAPASAGHFKYEYRRPTEAEEYEQQMLRFATLTREKLLEHLTQHPGPHTAGEIATAIAAPLDLVENLLNGGGGLVDTAQVVRVTGERYRLAPGEAA